MDTYGKLICKNNRGVAIVYVALLLFLLIGLVGVVVDFGYMYVVKGQLQNAADAAALAGAVELTGTDSNTNDLRQTDARQAAWTFACNNRAAGENVYVDDPGNPNPVACNNPPSSNELNGSNLASGKIIVGNWNVDSNTFTRATGHTDLPINAIIVNTGRSSTNRGGAVSVFFGKVLSPLWSKLAAASSAGAMKTTINVFGIPLCNVSCDTQTPLTTQSPNVTPGTRFYLRAGDDSSPGKTLTTAWTAFFDVTNKPNVIDYINGTKQPPNICKECIRTNTGQIVPAACELLEVINRYKQIHSVIDSSGTTYQISGIKGLVPVLDPSPSMCSPGVHGCLNDPGQQNATNSGLYMVYKYAEVIITDSIPQSNNCRSRPTTSGSEGIVMVGTAPGTSPGFSKLNCVDCDTPPPTYNSPIGSVLFDWFGATKIGM